VIRHKSGPVKGVVGGAYCLALALSVPSAASAQQKTPSGPKLRVAVSVLTEDALSVTTEYTPSSETTTMEIPPPQGFAMGLTEMLTTALVETGRFVVLERSQIDRVLGEQDFGASGRVNEETAAAQGQVIGAQVLLTGGVTEYSYTSSSLGGALSVLNAASAKLQQVRAMVALDIRLLDAATGEVIFSKRGSGKASTRMASADVTVGEQEFSTALAASTPLGKASREAIGEIVAAIVEELADVPWTGRIIDARADRIYVNAGKEDGIEPGVVFDVYAVGEPLVDPATGRTLGAPEERIGAIRVTEVKDRYSIAEAVVGDGFTRNNLLRFARTRGRR
jgi:curli biogenesis system outer membrane secretion channel CsgG